MLKRPHNSHTPASAPEDLVERLKAAANDAALLSQIVESSDSASIAAAFAALLPGGSSSTPNSSKLGKKVSFTNLWASASKNLRDFRGCPETR